VAGGNRGRHGSCPDVVPLALARRDRGASVRLGEADLAIVGSDASGWLDAQIGPADAPRGNDLFDTRRALEHVAAEREKRQLARNPPPGMTAEQILAGHYRDVIVADVRSRLATAAATTRPFAERLQWFWANHFTVSLLKGSTRGLVGAFERDAIRPNIAGRFETLLVASTTHPAMLRYLDNAQSAGPHSRVVALESRRAARTAESPRVTGINENLAREVLELHTLGAESARAGITRRPTSPRSRPLSGWRVAQTRAGAKAIRSIRNWHEPGTKVLLGRSYGEGPEALKAVLRDPLRIRRRRASWRPSSRAHFVADEPPPALVERMSAAYLRHDASLGAVYGHCSKTTSPERAACQAPEAGGIRRPRRHACTAGGERMFERAEVVNLRRASVRSASE
jgi:uncharacterized protein (DUF1800 family)